MDRIKKNIEYYIKGVPIGLIGFIIDSILMYILAKTKLHLNIQLYISSFISFIISFIGNKYFVFSTDYNNNNKIKVLYEIIFYILYEIFFIIIIVNSVVYITNILEIYILHIDVNILNKYPVIFDINYKKDKKDKNNKVIDNIQFKVIPNILFKHFFIFLLHTCLSFII